MAEYKEIHGTKIRNYTTNPDNPITGEVWYNDTDNVLKFQYPTVTTVGSWSTGGSVNTARGDSGGFGTQSAQLFAGGETPGPNFHAQTESYDGTSWTEVNDMNTARKCGGSAGTLTSGIFYGGNTPPYSNVVETWNGTNWTTGTSMNTARSDQGSAGVSSTSALGFGGTGSPPSPIYKDFTELWNGSSWTEVADLNTGRGDNMGCGTVTSALSAGGASPAKAVTESWNGSNWTEVADLAVVGMNAGSIGSSNTDGLMVGGANDSTDYFKTVEQWNGTSWSEQADLPVEVRTQGTGARGTTTAGLSVSGQISPGAQTTATYEWNVGLPVGAWSTGGSLNLERRLASGVGTKDAGLVFGGDNPGMFANTESYNGTSFTEVNDLNAAKRQMGQAGTQTSALGFGGYTGTAYIDDTESWNGTNWTEVNDMNNAHSGPGSAGVSNTSALCAGGNDSTTNNLTLTESWNGTNWTEVNDLNTGRTGLQGHGTKTSALVYGGYDYSPNITTKTESWNGTNWTEVSDLNQARYNFGGSGTDNTIGMCYGGDALSPTAIANTELWTGSSWTEVADLSIARGSEAGSRGVGTTSALCSGGNPGSGPERTSAVEEWSGSAVTTKTVSTD